MFNLSDRVRHKITGETGIVVGYGHQLIDSNYLTTVKVKITSLATTEASLVVEDLFTHWIFEPKEDSGIDFQNNKDLPSISSVI